MKPRVEVLYFSGCPHAEEAPRLTREVVGRLLPGGEVEPIVVETEEDGRTREFLGSPSIRIDGIDIPGHKSKGHDAVDASSVDAVITLCAEEACPAFLGKARRIHWGLPGSAPQFRQGRHKACP